MAESDRTADEKQRSALMHEAEAVAMEDLPNVPIYYYVSKDLVSQAVKGWVDNTKDIHRTRWLSRRALTRRLQGGGRAAAAPPGSPRWAPTSPAASSPASRRCW